jgi:ComF family protein
LYISNIFFYTLKMQEIESEIATRKDYGRFWRHLRDGITPPLCLNCRIWVGDEGALCAPCFNELRFIERPFCEKLALPFDYEGESDMLSREALENPPTFTQARAVFLYNPTVQKLIHGLKYFDRLELAKPFATWLARAGRDILHDCDMLTPVPLHWTRLFTRRYNQAGELARAVGKLTQKPYQPLALKRVRRTISQVDYSRMERYANMEGAFIAPFPHLVEGKIIVIIDDVMTSGATLESCARALIRAGAKEVRVLVVARVLENRYNPTF